MVRIFLQDVIEKLRFEDLSPNWNSSDLESFSKSKKLWNYQQEAVKNAIKVLWRYYEDFIDYHENERLEINSERKQRFFKWYKDNELDENLDIKLDKRKRNIYNLLTEYYSQIDSKIPYENFINRMCFWMATGSGKTLIIIKLIRILAELIERKEIPPYDILVLTHRDDLIEQFKKLVDEFNYTNETKIILKELKEYPEVERQPPLFGITVFYYRSDNLSDEQKEKIIDFRNYDNDGKWYIFLDEAHKGDKEESKRQHIYSILSRDGFLFNLSATFVDKRDVITCAYEFNLSSFINAGYGKHIAILKQEIRAFREKEDYSDEEKQKIVLKSLILLTYIKKFYRKVAKIQKNLYHNPLLLTLVNSVNVEDADLKLFFREIEKTGKGNVKEEVFEKALKELWEELKEEPEFMFEEDKKIKIDEEILKKITKEDILRYVYNSNSFGEIEISFRPSDKKQVAFKLITSDKHFALMKTGDMPKWLKEDLSRFNVNHRFEDEGFFERINKEDSDINILMGSRAFYEGWDSNRPNVINFINIGMGEDARKFILQSVGRGIRIEPVKNKRKRILSLYNLKEINEDLFDYIRDKSLPDALPIETLFIFGTNREALKAIMEKLEIEGKKEGETQLSLFSINPETKRHKLLVPVYKEVDSPIYERKKLPAFPIGEKDFEILNKFINFVNDDRVLLVHFEDKCSIDPKKTKFLREKLKNRGNLFKPGKRSFKDVDLLIQKLFDYLSVIPKELERLKLLEREIKHFENIKVYLEDVRDVSKIQNEIERVKNYPVKAKKFERELSKLSDETREEFKKLLIKDATGTYEHKHKKIDIRYITNHYYFPLILTTDEKVNYIKHIIRTPSEVKFIDDLEDYLNKGDNKLKKFDWWIFSKLDESLDDVYIPYYNPNVNKISPFYPDFIFWLKRGNGYFIVFVDPKGIEHSDWADKVNGYKEIFEKNRQEINYNGFKVKVKLFLRAKDASIIQQRFPEHSQYWFDNIGKILEGLIQDECV